MIKQTSKVVLITILLISSNLYAASFNCKKAGTFIEHTICGDDKLSQLDEDLSAAYKQARKDGDKNQIRKEQREWIKKERNKCKSITCLRGSYTNRISELSSYESEEDIINASVKADEYYEESVPESKGYNSYSKNKQVLPFEINHNFTTITSFSGVTNKNQTRYKIDYRDGLVKYIKYEKRTTNQVYEFNINDIESLSVKSQLAGSELKSGSLTMKYLSDSFVLFIMTSMDNLKWKTVYNGEESITGSNFTKTNNVMISFQKMDDLLEFKEKLLLLNSTIINE